MSEFQLDGPELKKMLRHAKKKPLPFAFNPGKSADEHYFAMHRKRPAKALAKVAKEEGAGKKAAYGTCQIDGKVMKLFCVITIPSMAKALKKFLKANKISLNVEVLNPDGGLLESDIEDLPSDRAFAGGDGGLAVGVIDGKQASATSAADLVARMKKAQALIADAPSAVGNRLNPALKKILEAIKSQNLRAAGKGLSQVEAVLAKRTASQGDTAPASDDMKPIKAQFAKLVPRARKVLDARPPAKRHLGGLVKSAGEALKGEDADEASRLVGLLKDQIEVWESRSADDQVSRDILDNA